MPYIPNQCPHCGAGLDPGEYCDCKPAISLYHEPMFQPQPLPRKPEPASASPHITISSDKIYARRGVDCTEGEFVCAVQRAAAKLQRIIEREGDLDGYRLTQEYTDALIQEELMAIQAERLYSPENYFKVLAV